MAPELPLTVTTNPPGRKCAPPARVPRLSKARSPNGPPLARRRRVSRAPPPGRRSCTLRLARALIEPLRMSVPEPELCLKRALMRGLIRIATVLFPRRRSKRALTELPAPALTVHVGLDPLQPFVQPAKT